MRLEKVQVRNFRGLEDVEAEFADRLSVIVGPNAVGKTTLLDAIRLPKSLLAPRTHQETHQFLLSLGAGSPVNVQRISAETIVNDRSKECLIRTVYRLTDEELNILEEAISELATDLVMQSFGQSFGGVLSRIGILSSEAGQQAVEEYKKTLSATVREMRAGQKQCILETVLNRKGAPEVVQSDSIGPAFLKALEMRLPPNQTLFSYFPADRALPTQDSIIQLGFGDAQQQVESHNSQPHLKYLRLKHTIFSAVASDKTGRESLEKDFAIIFSRILKGRRLSNIGIKDNGALEISVEDTDSGKVFSLDAMSSGEKGLILTFLLLKRSMCDGGLVLFDEPELHLNPAVCKLLVPFILEEYLIPNNLQMLICTHSPEILASAYDSENVALYHLVSSSILTVVRRQDEEEVSEALARLGSSESDGLLYKATVFVEGIQDVWTLETGFPEALRRCKLVDLGGRREIGKTIEKIQAAERKGKQVAPIHFIFDRDECPTELVSSDQVRILQLKRRCLENYLIDVDSLTDVLMSDEVAKLPVRNTAEVAKLLKDLAFNQLDELSVRTAFQSLNYENPGLRSSEIKGLNIDDSLAVLYSRLEKIQSQVGGLNRPQWIAELKVKCDEIKSRFKLEWEDKWKEECDGKRLFVDLQQHRPLKISLVNLKKRVISLMRTKKTDNWKLLNTELIDLLHPKTLE